MAGLTITSGVIGSVEDEDVQEIGFRPAGPGAWTAAVRVLVEVDEAGISGTQAQSIVVEFTGVPANIQNFLTSTALPLVKTAIKAKLSI